MALVGNRPLAAQTLPADTVLSLRAALELALEHNPGLLAARAGAGAAAFGAAAAGRQRVPKLQLGASYMYTAAEDALMMPGVLLNGPGLDNIFNRHIGEGALTLTVPLYTGGELSKRARAADAAAEGAGAGARAAAAEVLFRVAAKYHDILRLQRAVSATEASIASLLETRRILQLKLEVGRAAPFEVMRVNTRLANTQLDLLRERNALQRSLTDLEALVGVRLPDREFVLADTLRFVPVELAADTLLQQALAQRPEFQAARAAVARERALIGVATSQYLPHVSLLGSLGGNVGSRDSDLGQHSFVAVRVAIPVFNSPLAAQANEARARLDAAEATLEQLRLEIALEVDRALLDLRAAADQVEVARTALSEAEEALRIEQLRFDQGRATVNDVLDANAELLRAQVGLAGATAAHSTATDAVHRAAGTISVRALSP
ncbi:MAG: TolC family protein [Gemmatimonadetes bacterium]|nr:TolC family protein [Gemmatimonadota bacterium]